MTWKVFEWDGGPWYWEVFSRSGAKVNGGVAPSKLRADLMARDYIARNLREIRLYGPSAQPYYFA